MMKIVLPNGRALDVERIEGATPTLVFLHEGLGSVGLWRGWPARLAAATGLGACIYSRRGYGRSERHPHPWSLNYIEEEADLLPDVLDAAGINDAILIGHSDGGSIALAAAAGPQTKRVRGVITLAAHVSVEPENVTAIRAMGERFRSGDLRERLGRHHDQVDDVFWGWHDAWVSPGFSPWPARLDLADVMVPTTVVQGLADAYGSRRQAELIANAVSATVELCLIDGCAHAPHLDAPERTDEVTIAALRALSAS